MAVSWTDKQKRFVEEYCVDFNATQAAIRAGYSETTAGQMGHENLKKPEISAAIEERLDKLAMTAAEATKRMADIARADIGQFLQKVEVQKKDGTTYETLAIDPDAVLEHGGGVVQGFDQNGKIKMYDAKDALKTIMDAHGVFNHRQEIDHTIGEDLTIEIVGEEPDIQPPPVDDDSEE